MSGRNRTKRFKNNGEHHVFGVKMLEDYIEEITSCDECRVCLNSCPTYIVSKNLTLSPMYRIKASESILNGETITEEIIESLYKCPRCGACEHVCEKEVPTSKIVGEARIELVKMGFAPLEGHKKIIDWILEKGNSVMGDPSKRLDWLPPDYKIEGDYRIKEDRIKEDSDTLFFAGCIPSYITKDAARSSMLLLEKIGIKPLILEDEGCCGSYFIDSGKIDLTEDFYFKNVERFKSYDIKRIIVICAGCYKAFKMYYPEILGEMDLEVKHILEVLYENLSKLKIQKIDKKIAYHDPCHLGRVHGIYKEPRELLKSFNLIEMHRSMEKSFCCGADSGVRSVYREFSMDMAVDRLDEAEEIADELITSCSFCSFNLGHAAKKRGKDISVKYITEILLEGTE